MAEIGKIHIDFQVLKTHDPKVILIADTSDWKHILNRTSIVEITMPGGKVARELYWDQQKVNIFNSSILGITPKACAREDLRDLPDGIYTIKVMGSPDKFNKERKYLRTERFQLELDKLYLSTGLDFNTDKKELRGRLDDMDFLLREAESATRLGDIPKASMFFKEAKNLFEECKNCKSCE